MTAMSVKLFEVLLLIAAYPRCSMQLSMCVVWPNCTTGHSGTENYAYSSERRYCLFNDALNWTDAETACEMWGKEFPGVSTSLATFQDADDINAVKTKLNDGSSYWTGGRIGEWKWLKDDSPADFTKWNNVTGEPNKLEEQHCGILWNECDKFPWHPWHNRECSAGDKKVGFICEHKLDKNCPNISAVSSLKIKTTDSCFTVVTEAGQGTDWFQAQKMCADAHGVLAKVDNAEKQSTVSMQLKVDENDNYGYWIGLTNIHWLVFNGFPVERPTPGTKDCLKLNEGLSWLMDNCTEVHQYICQATITMSTLSSTIEASQTKTFPTTQPLPMTLKTEQNPTLSSHEARSFIQTGEPIEIHTQLTTSQQTEEGGNTESVAVPEAAQSDDEPMSEVAIIAIGSAAGGVVLIVILVVVVFAVKRRKRHISKPTNVNTHTYVNAGSQVTSHYEFEELVDDHTQQDEQTVAPTANLYADVEELPGKSPKMKSFAPQPPVAKEPSSGDVTELYAVVDKTHKNHTQTSMTLPETDRHKSVAKIDNKPMVPKKPSKSQFSDKVNDDSSGGDSKPSVPRKPSGLEHDADGDDQDQYTTSSGKTDDQKMAEVANANENVDETPIEMVDNSLYQSFQEDN